MPHRLRTGRRARLENYRSINALAEAVNSLYKAEVIHKSGPWRSLDQVEFATAKWVHWWNQKRLHSAVGDVPPAEFGAIYYRQQQAAATA